MTDAHLPGDDDPQEAAEIEALFRSRPDLEEVQLAQPDGGFVDAGQILADLKRRMAAVIDDWAHGFGFEDYLPQPDVEKLIDGGAERPLIAAAARYGAALVHSRYGSSDLAWQPTPEIDITEYINNVTEAGIDTGLAALDSELTRRGEADDDPLAALPGEFDDVADIVSAYSAVIFGFAVKINEIERELLNGAHAPESDQAAAAEWIAQESYSSIAARVHDVRAQAYQSLSPWIDRFPDRDHVQTADAVIDWAREQTSTAMGATDVLLMVEPGPDLDRQQAAARFLAGALEIKLDDLFQRVAQAVHGESFRAECANQNEAIGWTWQLIDTGLVTYLDEYRVDLCRAWVADDALAAEQRAGS